tara:strand:- start:98 stop:349 length:252 start_codon:yes stop_codon:yes gene_type:complete
MAIVDFINIPWVIALIFFYVGFYTCKSTFDRLEKRYEDEIAELKADVADCNEEIHSLNIKYGLEDIDWEANMWMDDFNEKPEA